MSSSDADCIRPLSDATIIANRLDHDFNSGLNRPKSLPDKPSDSMPPVATMSSSAEPGSATETVLDPISRVCAFQILPSPRILHSGCSPSTMQQILERTQSHNRLPGSSQGGVPVFADSGYSDDQYSGSKQAEPSSLRRVDSTNSGKEKK
jgi:hypothetical protein